MSGLFKTEIKIRGADGPQAAIVVSQQENRKTIVNLVVIRTDIEQTLGVNLDRQASDALVRALAFLWSTNDDAPTKQEVQK